MWTNQKRLTSAAVTWTLAFALAIGRTVYDQEILTVWAVVATGVASVTTCWQLLEIHLERSRDLVRAQVREDNEALVTQVAEQIAESLAAQNDRRVTRI